jgi:methionyl-tRNA formyltransferase
LIAVDEVQMEGKRRMSAAEFLRGNQVRSGERLGL